MTETTDSASTAPKKRAGGLNSMLLADLKAMAGGMGISGTGSMKKAQLVDAIKAAQASGPAAAPAGSARQKPRNAAAEGATSETDTSAGSSKAAGSASTGDTAQTARPEVKTRTRGGASRAASAAGSEQPAQESRAQDAPVKQETAAEAPRERQDPTSEQDKGQDKGQDKRQDKGQGKDRDQGQDKGQPKGQAKDDKAQDKGGNDAAGEAKRKQQDAHQDSQNADDEGRTGRNRRRRGRDRNRTPGAGPGGQGPTGHQGGQGGQGGGNQRQDRHEPDTTILEDDVLVPAAGILDVLDNYAFVRTSGYLPGADDVYVSLSMVRKFGLRRGDAIVGEVRQPREGERKEKFNPMVRIDSVNGGEPSQAVHRKEFDKLTPVHPSDRLRLETGPDNLIGRVIDLVAPLGKGQRGLIVSPAKAGKTMVVQAIANSITSNNPECHLMVVLVDERPEEVTDFQRSVKGEVISSTFDRPAGDHAIVAELAIERAKRLVELGHDVVVLLDGLTRLARAYNLSGPASGRILPGGVDAAALHPPKRFFGAARKVENGGSLTILATATVESGSPTDELIFEAFSGTANMELRLRSELAERRLFPAIDAVRSATRREDLLMSSEELAIVGKLRRVLAGLGDEQALELLLARVANTHTNIEFLMQIDKMKPAPGSED